MSITFQVVGSRIEVRCPYDYKDHCKRVDEGRWDAGRGCWYYPLSAYSAEQIRDAFRDLGQNGVKIQADQTFRALLADKAHASLLVTGSHPMTGPDPATPLWGNQLDALQWGLHRPALMLAHDVGAGKSLTTIALLLKRNLRRILIVATPKLVTNMSWPDQLHEHAPGRFVTVTLAPGMPGARRMQIANRAMREYASVDRIEGTRSHGKVPPEPALVIIINYEAVLSKPIHDWLLKQSWDCIILDESHHIKAAGGKISRFFATMTRRSDWRIGLTGTPMPHSPLDIYAQYRFLDPSIYGSSYAVFRSRYAIINPQMHNMVVGYQQLDDLEARMRSIMHQAATPPELLPDFDDIPLYVTLSPEAEAHYERLESEFYTALGDEPNFLTIKNALGKLLRLQQLTGGWLPDDTGQSHRVDTSKQDTLAEHIANQKRDEPIVVFARFHHDLDAIKEAAALDNRRVGEISGRVDDYQAWRDGALDVVAVQTEAGSEGLNALVSSRYCYFYSLGYSLGRYTQARGRQRRPGQKREGIYYHLIARGTVDETVYKALSKRQNVIEAIMGRKTEGQEAAE